MTQIVLRPACLAIVTPGVTTADALCFFSSRLSLLTLCPMLYAMLARPDHISLFEERCRFCMDALLFFRPEPGAVLRFLPALFAMEGLVLGDMPDVITWKVMPVSARHP